MGGVGSFNRVNRTLYIAKMGESPDKNQTKETLLRHFGEWGKIVKCELAAGVRCPEYPDRLREYPVQSRHSICDLRI